MTSLMNMKPHQFAALKVAHTERTMTFGELAGALAEIYGVPQKEATAFHGRIKNFIRLGFPASAHSGKGKTHRYTVQEQRELCVVLELSRVGLPPQYAIEIATAYYDNLMFIASIGGRCDVEPLIPFGSLNVESAITVDMSIYRPIFEVPPPPRIRDVIDVREPESSPA